jgi:hypothetical protein
VRLTSCGFIQQLKLVMDSIIWAFRHTERNVAETGLNLLLEMLTNFQVTLHLLPYWGMTLVVGLKHCVMANIAVTLINIPTSMQN